LITSLDDYSRFMLYAVLIKTETSWAHILALQTVILRYGLPYTYYVNSHSIFRFVRGRDSLWYKHHLLTDEATPQWKQALQDCNVKVTYALSPQAKGRIERLFGTLQDRLVKEMRLRGIRTIEEANRFLEEYLPLYNSRFAVCPKRKDNLHRPVGRGVNLDAILCIKTERTLRNDFTVAHNHKLYQIEDKVRGVKVMVQDRLDGSLVMTYKGERLRFREITTRPVKEQPVSVRIRKPYTPPSDHPWRRGFKFGIHKYERGKPIESKI